MNARRLAPLAVLMCSLAMSAWWVRAADDPPEKHSSRASLGIMVEPTPPDAQHPGVIVREAPANSPAAKAGMKSGDVIVKIGDKQVKDFDALANSLAQHKPGDKVTFQVMRDGQEKTLTATLGESAIRSASRDDVFSREKRRAFLGIQMTEMTPEARNRFGVTADQGVLVTEVVPGTPAEHAGLRPGDVITSIDGKNITQARQLRDAIQNAGAGKEVTLKVARARETREVKAKLEETPADVFFREPQAIPREPGARPMQPPIFEELRRLEQQVDRLQKRVQELERKLEKQPSK